MNLRSLSAAASIAALAVAPCLADGPALRVGAIVGEGTPRERAVREGLGLACALLNQERGDKPLVEVLLLDPHGNAEELCAHLATLEAQGVRLLADVAPIPSLLDCAPSLWSWTGAGVTTAEDPRLRGAFGRRIVRAGPWRGAPGGALALWARDLGLTRPLVVHEATEWGRACRDAFQVAWGGAGSAVVVELGSGSPAAKAAAVQHQADGVVLLACAEATQAALAADLGPCTGPILCAGGPGVDAAITDAATRARVLTLDPIAPSGARHEAAVAAWRAVHGSGDPDPAVLVGFDALDVLVRAAWAAGGDPDRTLGDLRATRCEGASGPVSFVGDERPVPPFRRLRLLANGGTAAWSQGGQ